MKKHHPSKTFKQLYFSIIDDFLAQICNSDLNYCVRDYYIPYEISRIFEEYKNQAVSKMPGKRLDRHKLASCICGAIIKAKPLVGFQGAVILKKANEILGLHVGMAVLKYYMLYDLQCETDAYEYLRENFELQFPSLNENICDTQEYKINLSNALYWSHKLCEITQNECFCYDIWAYAKIFYHLELYNRDLLKNAYTEYIQNHTTR